MSRFSKDFIQYSDKKVKSETKNLALYFATHISLYVILVFFAVFFAWYTVFITTHKFYAVSGVSMMSTLNGQITQEQLENNIVNANKLSYDAVYVDKLTKPKLFDIIVVEKPDNESVIKRLMAMEGDYITISKGLTSDGKDCFYFYRIPNGAVLGDYSDKQAKLEESGSNGYQLYNPESLWIHKSISTKTTSSFEAGVEQSVLNFEYEYNFFNNFLQFYQNVNPIYNYHVSSNGLVYVQVPQNQIFYMGDNRAYSTDSRERGFCDKKYVVGRAEFVVYNYNFGNRMWEVIKFYFREMEEFFAR